MMKEGRVIDRNEMKRLYDSGLSMEAVARKLRCDASTVKRALEKMGVRIERRWLRGRMSPRWRGGRWACGGYRYVSRPEHPLAMCNGYVAEHVLVYEEANGVRLKKGQVVHHRNGKRSDNRPENLELMTGLSQHRKLHARMEQEKLYSEAVMVEIKVLYEAGMSCRDLAVRLGRSKEYVQNRVRRMGIVRLRWGWRQIMKKRMRWMADRK